MADKKNSTDPAAESFAAESAEGCDPYRKVEIMLPRPRPGDENFELVGVNGKMYKIQKGVRVNVPWCVSEILRNREDAEMKRDEYVERVEIKNA